MRRKKSLEKAHPKGETRRAGQNRKSVTVDTYGGPVHVEWNPDAAVTPMGQLPFFIEFLKTADLYDPWVEESPLRYQSPNAPSKRDVLGTTFLSVMSGHRRYSHITSIRCDTLNPSLLGMKKVVSEDSVRRGLKSCEGGASEAWLQKHLRRCVEPLLGEPWILDIDTTVKPLYGHQEGAVKGYNPQKPGRPSHAYHTYFMANTRLALDVEIQRGNQTAARYSQPGLWAFLDGLPKWAQPTLVRGDNAFGNEPVMQEAEARNQEYLFKLRQTKNVQKLVAHLFGQGEWVPAGQGWEGVGSELCLQGWTRSRRVVVLRRKLRGGGVVTKTSSQLALFSLENGADIQTYETAVLVTSLPDKILAIAQHYRDRADVENNFDELKNQWTWGGYTTQDLKRCQIMARITALLYNWWSLFVRLAIPQKHAEAITSRPLLLEAIGRKTHHQGQTKVTITSTHAKAEKVQVILNTISRFLAKIRNAEQLSWDERWRWILSRIFLYFLRGRLLKPPPFFEAVG